MLWLVDKKKTKQAGGNHKTMIICQFQNALSHIRTNSIYKSTLSHCIIESNIFCVSFLTVFLCVYPQWGVFLLFQSMWWDGVGSETAACGWCCGGVFHFTDCLRHMHEDITMLCIPCTETNQCCTAEPGCSSPRNKTEKLTLMRIFFHLFMGIMLCYFWILLILM